jgi:hypothetical protein
MPLVVKRAFAQRTAGDNFGERYREDRSDLFAVERETRRGIESPDDRRNDEAARSLFQRGQRSHDGDVLGLNAKLFGKLPQRGFHGIAFIDWIGESTGKSDLARITPEVSCAFDEDDVVRSVLENRNQYRAAPAIFVRGRFVSPYRY